MENCSHLCPIGRLVDELAVRDQFAVSRRLAFGGARTLACFFPTLRTLSWWPSTGAGAQLLFRDANTWMMTGVWVIAQLPKLPAVAFLTISCAFGAALAE